MNEDFSPRKRDDLDLKIRLQNCERHEEAEHGIIILFQITQAWEHQIKLSGGGFKTNKRKYFPTQHVIKLEFFATGSCGCQKVLKMN